MSETAAHFYAPQPRAIAKAAGLRQFFPAKPCRAGHVTWWWVSGGCVECSNQRKRDWVKANPERAKDYGRAHYVAHADDYKERAAAWKVANPGRSVRSKPNQEKRRAAERRRRAANPAKYRALVQNRKAQRRGAAGSFTLADLIWIDRKQKGRCAYCRTMLCVGNRELDHIQPIAKGGTNHRSNLQFLCVPCNRSKGAKDPLVFARQKGLLL